MVTYIHTDDDLLDYIEEVLPKLGDTPTQTKLADICIRLRAILREIQRTSGGDPRTVGPKRDRAAYMRVYRAEKRLYNKVKRESEKKRVPSTSLLPPLEQN